VFASCNLAFFLSSMAVMEGSSPSEKLQSTYWTALSKNWMVWPLVQMANFKFVPLDQRVLVVNTISLGKLGQFEALNNADISKAGTAISLISTLRALPLKRIPTSLHHKKRQTNHFTCQQLRLFRDPTIDNIKR